MKNIGGIVVTAAAVALSAALLLGQAPQSSDEKAKAKAALKAKQIAQAFENNATVITFYDRQGKTVGTVGERALYGAPVLSPDRTRVAVLKNDLQAETSDLWILEVATGKATRMTNSAAREFVQGPVWSPDGLHVAYSALRNASEGIYKKAASGEGPEELLYKNPGFGLNLSDWSMDGRFLSFAKSDLTGGVLYLLPLSGQGERQPIEVSKSELRMFAPRFSPDGKYLSYIVMNQTQKAEAFVRPVDSSSSGGPGAGAQQISDNVQSPVLWRRDGKELYYVGPDRSVMVAEVTTAPAFQMGLAKVLFRPPGAVPVGLAGMSIDGERFIALPPPRGPQLQQITVFDREGKVVSKVSEPGLFSQPAFSPDGKRLAVMRGDLEKSTQDIWTFDIATGKAARVTDDAPPKNSPMWSPDGKHLLYVSMRGSYAGIYRKASDGSGSEELLFQYTAGAGIQLTDISPDGKFLTLSSGGVILVVALTGNDPLARKAIEFSREEFDVALGRFSPDGRQMAYRSNEADPDRFEIFVRPFDGTTGTAAAGEKRQVSKDGAQGMLHWRGDGKELFWRDLAPETTDLLVKSVELSTTPPFQVGIPKVLFRLPGPLGGNLGNVSRDGQRFVFAINVPAQ